MANPIPLPLPIVVIMAITLANVSARTIGSGYLEQESGQLSQYGQLSRQDTVLDGYRECRGCLQKKLLSLTFSDAVAQPTIQRSKRIENVQFDNIAMYHQIPHQFLLNQIYRFEGRLIVPDQYTHYNNYIQMGYNTIHAVFIDYNTFEKFICSEQLKPSKQFEVSCRMERVGQYYLSVFVGRSGRSSGLLRGVVGVELGDLVGEGIQISGELMPVKLWVQIVDNNLYVAWSFVANLTNLTIYQQGNQKNKKQYLLSNNHQKYKIPFSDFYNFTTSQTCIQISFASSTDGTYKNINKKYIDHISKIVFNATNHAFNLRKISKNKKNYIQYSIPWKVNVNQTVNISLSFQESVKNTIYIFQPDSQVRRAYFLSPSGQRLNENIAAQTLLNIQLIFYKQGTHLIQINNRQGTAVLNRPIYVGQVYPFIPDYKDLIQANYNSIVKNSQEQILVNYYRKTTMQIDIVQPKTNSTIVQKIQFLLQLLNGLRKKNNASPLFIDAQLNKIAEYHNKDMIENNYINHIDSNGQKAKDRAKRFGFSGTVTENIGKAKSLTQIHLGLERSPLHFLNSIQKSWERVGIAVDQIIQEELYIATYIFSMRDLQKYPLDELQIKNIQQQVVQIITKKNPNIIQQNQQLSTCLKQWMQSNRQEQLQSFAKTRNYSTVTVKEVSFSFLFSFDLIKSISTAYGKIFEKFDMYKFVAVGVGQRKQQGQIIEIFVLFML